MGGSWDADGGQPESFRNNVEYGDIVMIRHKGPFALVRVIGEVEDNDDESMWFDIRRPAIDGCIAATANFDPICDINGSDGDYLWLRDS